MTGHSDSQHPGIVYDKVCMLASLIHEAVQDLTRHKKVLVSGAFACLSLVLQSLCDFFSPYSTSVLLLVLLLVYLFDWAFEAAGKGILRYSVPKWLSFPESMRGAVFTACVLFITIDLWVYRSNILHKEEITIFAGGRGE